MKIRWILLLALAGAMSLLTGCTFHAVPVGTVAPASEIRVDKHRDVTVGLYIDEQIARLGSSARVVGYVCSAHNYTLNLGPGLVHSIHDVVEAGFRGVEPVERHTVPVDQMPIVLQFTLEEYDPTIRFATGFWTTTATGNVDIALRVIALGTGGRELLRAIIAGDGSEDAEGAECFVGSAALSEAGEEAIEELLENFVYRVINSDLLD